MLPSPSQKPAAHAWSNIFDIHVFEVIVVVLRRLLLLSPSGRRLLFLILFFIIFLFVLFVFLICLFVFIFLLVIVGNVQLALREERVDLRGNPLVALAVVVDVVGDRRAHGLADDGIGIEVDCPAGDVLADRSVDEVTQRPQRLFLQRRVTEESLALVLHGLDDDALPADVTTRLVLRRLYLRVVQLDQVLALWYMSA